VARAPGQNYELEIAGGWIIWSPKVRELREKKYSL
jgi:hypothetical protein